MLSPGSRGVVSLSRRKKYPLLLCKTHLRHISLCSQLLHPLTRKSLWTLPAQISPLLFVPPVQQRRQSDLLGVSQSSWISCFGAVLKVTEILPALWGQVGSSGGVLQRAAGTERSRQEGELFLSGLCCSKVSAQAGWAEGGCRTPLPQREYLGSLSDPPPFSFFTSLCTLSLPLSENWIWCSPHHLFQGNSLYVDKQLPHLSLLSVSKRWKGFLQFPVLWCHISLITNRSSAPGILLIFMSQRSQCLFLHKLFVFNYMTCTS